MTDMWSMVGMVRTLQDTANGVQLRERDVEVDLMDI